MIYFVQRILWIVPTLICVSLLTFLFINLAPGGPVETQLAKLKFTNSSSPAVSDEMVRRLKAEYGLDRPLGVRYFNWLARMCALDFGESFFYRRPAMEVLRERLPVTLAFGLLTVIFMYGLGVPLGVYKALAHGRLWDLQTTWLLLAASAVPPLVLGLFLRAWLAGGLGWFPLGDVQSDQFESLGILSQLVDRLWHLILPLVCYSLGGMVLLVFLTKNSMLSQLDFEYVKAARAKGVNKNRVIWVHVFRNATIPIINSLASILLLFFTGSIVVEQVFNIDGLGLLSYNALINRDYNLILALVVIQSALAILGRLFADLLFVWADPRIRF